MEEAREFTGEVQQEPVMEPAQEMDCETTQEPCTCETEQVLPCVEEEKSHKKSRRGLKILLRITAAILVVAMIAGGCIATAWVMDHYWQQRVSAANGQIVAANKQIANLHEQIEHLEEKIESNSFTGNGNSISGTPNASADGLTPGQVYAQNVDSVVAITCVITQNSFGQTTQGSSSGTGFILSENGYVVTNYHVVEGATKVTVTTHKEKKYEASLVGYDATNDIALLKVNATGLQAAKLGSSSDLIVGDQVVAIGNALGELGSSLTVGYISGKDRTVSTDGSIINMLQTDAAINPGNSGGPLFNMKGEVIGITTAKYSGTTSSGASIEGLGFAIPIDDVAKKLQDLADFGYVTGAYLGVSVMDMDPTVLDAYGFPRGAYVAEVVTGNCAQKAGVRAKDMIIAIGEYQVDSVNGLTRALQNFKGGDVTTITVWRAGAEIVLDITLDEKPAPSAG